MKACPECYAPVNRRGRCDRCNPAPQVARRDYGMDIAGRHYERLPQPAGPLTLSTEFLLSQQLVRLALEADPTLPRPIDPRRLIAGG